MSAQLDRRLVAVMFTDMAGYTALMQTDERLAVDKRERYMSALDSHHGAFGGTVVQRLGDGSMSMFPSSLAAVQAAVAIQLELAAHSVPVRIGIHVGEVLVEPERLTGDAVNIAARIESFAVPGGVLLSDAAYAQVQNRSDVAVVALGRFRLKNVGRPFELYAVATDGVVVPDPAALEGKGESAGLPSNLPQLVTPLVGRADDLGALVALVRGNRVVTILGAGGVGKTRALVELGRQLSPEFLDGVAFVALADITEAADFMPAFAEALDVKESEDRRLGEGIVALIGDRKALLLLDNLEQIVEAAAPEIARLVDRCPQLRIVTTSRAPLRITAEREYPLAPLAIDSAVKLFAGLAGLAATDDPAIAEICRRLDGLPLALELAAAHVRLLSPEALLERLDRALDVLTSGARDSPQRHQTLRATIEWSHELLAEPEQRLFRRMAVFSGGATLVDLEIVCAEDGASCLDQLQSLVDNALVHSGGRLWMLQTISEFAGERLEASGEAGEITRRHAARYAEVAREIRDGVEGAAQIASVERGIAEEGNLQAALETLVAAARSGDEAAAEQGMQMCGDLWMYWHLRGKNLTARDYAAAFLDTDAAAAATAGRAGALRTAGLAAWMLGAPDRAEDLWAEAYGIASALGAERELCVSSMARALAHLGIDNDAAHRWASEGVERSSALGFAWAEGFGSTFAGMASTLAGDLDAAESQFHHALGIQQRLGDEEGAGLSLGGLAQLAALRGDLVAALDLYAKSLAAFVACGDRAEEARILSETGWTHLQNDDPAVARRLFLESARAYTDVASVRGVGLSLIGLAASEAVEGRPKEAVKIAAAAEVYAQEEGIVNFYSDETPGRELVERARLELPMDELARATEAGLRFTIEEALELARVRS